MFGKNNPKSFQNRLAEHRRYYEKEDGSIGLTQERLAELLEVDTSTVRHWEHGRHRPHRIHRNNLRDLFPGL